jgi:hypothetical protein
MREIPGLKKRPSTSELIDWLKLLIFGKITSKELSSIDLTKERPPYSGSLLKNEKDHELVEGLKYRFRR